MNTSAPARTKTSNGTYRLIRQVHLWVGAWGAIAAILFGITGLILNHRMGENPWPQGDSNPVSETMIDLPESARSSVETASVWLRNTQGLDAHTLRKPRPGESRGGRAASPDTWTLSGGSVRNAWSAEYAPGNAQMTVKRTQHSSLAVFNRLHKGIGGNALWTVLTDSYAIAMILLGISGIWMWARGRTPKQMLLSVMTLGIAALLSALVIAFA